ncbi:DUF6087 family protein [Streptomyces smyrnaeus]|uniref:DUF6087 family protein n=1 Tax=Streptomyces smyrnaeus TaxID=1387713 RepID=UPI0033F201C0
MGEEPLEDWARRREERQAQGKPAGGAAHRGPYRGTHVDPDSPRVIQRWTGAEGETVGVIDDLAAAKALLFPQRPVLNGHEKQSCPRDLPKTVTSNIHSVTACPACGDVVTRSTKPELGAAG